eukprot:scaffold5477_cov124-Isochrysis_galbana.AAC.8
MQPLAESGLISLRDKRALPAAWHFEFEDQCWLRRPGQLDKVLTIGQSYLEFHPGLEHSCIARHAVEDAPFRDSIQPWSIAVLALGDIILHRIEIGCDFSRRCRYTCSRVGRVWSRLAHGRLRRRLRSRWG